MRKKVKLALVEETKKNNLEVKCIHIARKLVTISAVREPRILSSVVNWIGNTESLMTKLLSGLELIIKSYLS